MRRCQLRKIGKVCPVLSLDAENKPLFLSFSRLLLFAPSCVHDDKLNLLQCTQIMLPGLSFMSAALLLRSFPLLPVKDRIQCKIACLCFQCLHHKNMPPCLSDLPHLYHPSRMLHSLGISLLTVPCFSF